MISQRRLKALLAEAKEHAGPDPVLQAAYLAGRVLALETTGFNRTLNQSVRAIKYKGVETIEPVQQPDSIKSQSSIDRGGE